jgi:hypothetical protein
MNRSTTERLLRNYFNARKSWEGFCFLNNLDLKTNKPEIRKYTDNNELLYYARYLLFKDLHLELYKILKDSRSTIDNIFGLLKNHKSHQADLHLKKLNIFKSEIKLLTDTRDKLYAHLDANYKEYLSSVNVNNYYHIFVLIEQAITILGKENELLKLLNTITSRDEFELNL